LQCGANLGLGSAIPSFKHSQDMQPQEPNTNSILIPILAIADLRSGESWEWRPDTKFCCFAGMQLIVFDTMATPITVPYTLSVRKHNLSAKLGRERLPLHCYCSFITSWLCQFRSPIVVHRDAFPDYNEFRIRSQEWS